MTDQDHRHRSLPLERVCRYRLATGKAGVGAKYGGDPVYRRVLLALPLVCDRHPDIARRVARAARSGFKDANLGRDPAAVQDAHGAYTRQPDGGNDSGAA